MSTPTSVTQSQLGFAEELAPYGQEVLGRAQALATQTPYQAYTGEQVAQFSPLQQQSYDYAKQMTSAPQLQDATAMAGQAGLGALNTQYTFNPSNFDSTTAKSMMNPYMQNVVDVQSQQAKRQAEIQNQGQQAQAANAGAFGGGRDAIMRAQGNAELQRNLQGIQATGLNNAYNQAQTQYNTQNQQNAQQQQFGASLGMQGLGLANTAANTLGSLGQTQYAQNVGLTGLQNQLGLQQQQQAQNVLNADFQNFQNEINDPYKKLGFYSDIVRGAPIMQTGSSVYQQGPSAIQNLTSLGLGAYGLSSLFGGSGSGQAAKAEGGVIKGYARGGSVTSPEFKRYAVDRIDPRQLQLAQRNAMARGDRETAGYTADEMAEDAALRRGIAGAMPEGASVVRAAGGGIVAFAKRGLADSDSAEESDDAYIDRIVTGDVEGEDDEEGGTAGGGGFSGTPTVGGIVSSLLNTKTRTMSPAAQRELFKYNLKRDTADIGPNKGADEYAKYLQGMETGRADAMSRGHGMTALRAAAALQKSGVNNSDRWGSAMGAVADSEEKLQGADQAKQHYLAQAKFALSDAQRKERAGLVSGARASTSAYVKYMQKAQEQEGKAKFQAGKLMVDQERARAIASRGAGGAGKIQKVPEQLAAAETAYENDPSDANLKNVTALRRTAERLRDSGPGKLAVATEGNEIKRTKMYEDALGELKITPAYKKAAPAQRAEMEAATRTRIMRMPIPEDKQDAPASTGGKNDYSHLWGGKP